LPRKAIQAATEGTAPRPEASDALQLLVDNLPVGAWTTDRSLRFTWVTEGAGTRVGLTPGSLIGKRIHDLRPEQEDRPALAAHERALSGESVAYDTDFADRWFSCLVEPLRDEAGDVVGVIGVALDTTDRKRTEDTLREVTRGYRAISELTSDVGYSMASSPDGGFEFEWVTEGFERLTGFPLEEANAVGITNLVHPDDTGSVREQLEQAFTGQQMEAEHRITTRAGDTLWVRNQARPHREPDGRITRVYGAIQDVTERRQAQEELQRTVSDLRRTDRERLRLLVYLVRAQEDERKRIAEGIHDDSIQIMATVGLRLGMLARRVESSEDRAQVEELQELVERSVARLRTLLFELTPPELKRAGLAAAVMELLRKMASEEPRSMAYEVANRLHGEPPEETQVLLYRMAQEALTNVRKHAQASRVDVAIEEEDGGVLMEVRDDGMGFSASETLSRPGHLGLAAMRERAEMARGWWTIDSTPGEGTAVRFWLPLQTLQDRPPTA
jgi:PAS domain S-box-containing protein